MNKNYFDESGNLVNVENKSLAEIYMDGAKQNRWIPVEDALPDGNRLVLVHYIDNYHDSYAVAFFGKFTGKWIEPISGQFLDVDRWQDIEPYEAGMKALKKGDIIIGAYEFSDRRKPMLCIQSRNAIVSYGSFRNKESAENFMDALAEFVGAIEESEVPNE